MKIIFYLFLTISIISCAETEFPADIDLQQEVSLGESKMYLNGELVNYQPRFLEDIINHQLILVFEEETNQNVINKLGFSALSVAAGNYKLHTERQLFIGAKSSFGQIVGFEFDGWDYEIYKQEEGFLNITEIDTTNLILKGNFKAFFELKNKNGFEDTGLPDKIKFEGIFHENYIRG